MEKFFGKRTCFWRHTDRSISESIELLSDKNSLKWTVTTLATAAAMEKNEISVLIISYVLCNVHVSDSDTDAYMLWIAFCI